VVAMDQSGVGGIGVDLTGKIADSTTVSAARAPRRPATRSTRSGREATSGVLLAPLRRATGREVRSDEDGVLSLTNDAKGRPVSAFSRADTAGDLDGTDRRTSNPW